MKKLRVALFLAPFCVFGLIYEPTPPSCSADDWFHFGEESPDFAIAELE